MGKAREFVIRTFNPAAEGAFDSTGRITKLSTYSEKTLSKQFEAIAEMMLSNANTVAEIGINKANGATKFNLTDLTAGQTSTYGVEHVTIVVNTDIIDQAEIRRVGKEVREIIQTWAEKSRTRGIRGFRFSAIKTPVFEKNKDNGAYDLKFEALLSTFIFYNQNQGTVAGCSNFLPDLSLFKKRLEKAIGINVIMYDHSALGVGRI